MRIVIGVCFVVATGPLAAQQVSPRALQKPEAEFAQSFDAVQSIRELPGGKVLVTDLGPRTVIMADFGSGEQTTVGRNGQGPGEYQFPGDLLTLAGDTTLLVDRVSRRFLVIGSDGKVGKTISFPDGIQGLGEPRATDRQGRIYFQGSPLGAGPDGGEFGQPADSVPVIRWDRSTNKLDTVARVKVPALKMQVSGDQNARAVMVRPQPFAPSDEWAVATDGRMAVARVGDFHVEWLGESAPARGAPVRYDRLKVAEGDKQLFLTNLRTSRNRITINRGGGGGAGRGREIQPPEPSVAEFEWPDFKPPFVSRGAYMAPEGQLWLVRSTTVRDSTPVFDTFDRTGALTGRITLPPGRRLVGLGQGTLYAVRTDADGLQWLERYRR